jgi:hypothetical protein
VSIPSGAKAPLISAVADGLKPVPFKAILIHKTHNVTRNNDKYGLEISSYASTLGSAKYMEQQPWYCIQAIAKIPQA